MLGSKQKLARPPIMIAFFNRYLELKHYIVKQIMLAAITTTRLTLRQITYADNDALFAMRSDKETMRFIPRPLAVAPEDSKVLIDNMLKGIEDKSSINWAITLSGDDTLIGVAGFVRTNLANHSAEIGYLLNSKHQGKGIMNETVAAIINHGFNQLNLNRIEAIIDPRNIASEKLLQKLGFEKEGHLKQNVFFNNSYLDSVYYALLKNKIS